MSKLLEKLERISEGSGQPMGFGAATRTKISQMLIIASVPAGNAQLIALATKEGVDALLLTADFEKDSKTLSKMSHTKSEILRGISLETVSKDDIEQLIELGYDFVIFNPAKTRAAILMDERIGKVLKIDTSLPENLAKAVNRLEVDAVLLSSDSGEDSDFTVSQLMVLERLASGAGKYILMTMPSGWSISDIEILWALGVRAVVVDMSVEQPEQMLSQVKEAIQKLPITRKKSREKFRATLPVSRAQSKKAEPEEDEDEEP